MELFLVLLIKHAIVDLGIQSHLRNIDKFTYLGNGHVHYLQHALGTAFVAIFFLEPSSCLAITIIDYLAHWHIDWAKHRFNTLVRVVPRTAAWWWTNVVDQILHFTTYYVIALLYAA